MAPHQAFYPVRKAYREVYEELGTGLDKTLYIEALAQKLKNTCRHYETTVTLPCSAGGIMHADLTYAYRKVYVKLTRSPAGISDGVCKKMQFRLKATGIPLGIILNFGKEEPEYRQVVYMEHLQRRSRRVLRNRACTAS
jgi:GxxExxY protein